MKRLVVKTLDMISVALFVAMLILGTIVGWEQGEMRGIAPIGALLGLLLSFIIGVLIFGALFVVLEISENLRRIRDLVEKGAAVQKA